jgi:undecaprenyl-diphosphatase
VTALYIILAVILFIVVLFSIRVNVIVEMNETNKVILKYMFLKFKLVDSSEPQKEKKTKDKTLIAGAALLIAFVIWTAMIQMVDVQAVGVNGTDIGFAVVNCWFHQLTGVHMSLYVITDWLGLVPVAVGMMFAAVGLVQLIKRRRLLKVDNDILLLGIYYIVVIAGYLIFEMIPINYRPVLINGFMEASYPSSTTLLVISTR